ncbi:HlyD family secretion protein [Myxococcus sp. K15C18031901]|uniref:efflux RND transporter periplasmic adaptor subunit n=1 Tax=Myxococcus dinghuensis TaxID=2906761 RepID=UPI0020A728A6|nr:HlyD family secretion protein [Myxococcus dinghuensis]MCP3102092.1 HlyD family secretion protein [Myxococcus dinghuensis]
MATSPRLANVLALSRKVLVTVILVVLAVLGGYELWFYYEREPRTRDGRVRADVVQVASEVAGRVTEVLVRDNQGVQQGDVLFRVDPARYTLAVQQAESTLANARAALRQAETDARRYHDLSGVVSDERRQQVATQAQQARASFDLATSNLELAKLNLERSTVYAPVDGTITNLLLRPGAYVGSGSPAMAVVDRHSIYVAGYFEETKLNRIRVGAPVEVRLMGESAVLRGRVESIALAVEDRERSTGSQMLPNVNPTFPWVRIAQRVPVRIALEEYPRRMRLIAGRTASVEVLPWEDDGDDLERETPRTTRAAKEAP